MELKDLIVDYTSTDFASAVRQLLPKGAYWQETENAELNNLINGMGAEFKTIHDECQLNLLTEIRTELFGWRIRDYQNLIGSFSIDSIVFDDIKTPNLIYVDFFGRYKNIFECKEEIERKRLPHTRFHYRNKISGDAILNVSSHRKINRHRKYIL